MLVEGNQLPDAITVASLAILLSSALLAQIYKMPGPEVRVVATKAMAIRAVVVGMIMGMGKTMVGPCHGCT